MVFLDGCRARRGFDLLESVLKSKAASGGKSEKREKKMERAKGFEPFAKNPESPDSECFPKPAKPDHTQIRAHAGGVTCPDLAIVVAVWSKLPTPLKAAILAIVGSVTSSPEVEP